MFCCFCGIFQVSLDLVCLKSCIHHCSMQNVVGGKKAAQYMHSNFITSVEPYHCPHTLRHSVKLSCVINNLWNKSINSASRDVYTSRYKRFLIFRNTVRGEEISRNGTSNISDDILICFVSYFHSVLGLKTFYYQVISCWNTSFVNVYKIF